MLVLSRQRDETIMIGDDIELTIVDIRGDKVRIGIEAPSSIAVHRKEVYEAIKRENEQAANYRGDLDELKRGLGGRVDNGKGGTVLPKAAKLVARTNQARESA
ncbi:MAG: carbon storage regulator CsrA [Phycisphaerales bacterium]|nr:carbon storage regulator CsrA [Phycisphaerales bacterium]